ATLIVNDNASGSPHSITLSATGEDFSLPKTGTLTPGSIPQSGSATSTITVTPGAGLTAAIDLTCTVTSSVNLSPVPTCALNPSQLTSGTTSSTLTVTPVKAAAMLTAPPSPIHHSSIFYAMWLVLPGIVFTTAGIGTVRR